MSLASESGVILIGYHFHCDNSVPDAAYWLQFLMILSNDFQGAGSKQVTSSFILIDSQHFSKV